MTFRLLLPGHDTIECAYYLASGSDCLLDYERLAAQTLRLFYPLMFDYPAGFSRMLSGLDFMLNPGKEVILFLPAPSKVAQEMSDRLRCRADEYLTTVGIRGSQPDSLTRRLIPMSRERAAVNNKPTAYVCSQFTCNEPVHDADSLDALLDQTVGSLDTGAASK